jgi:hypothetical protein
MFVRLTGWIAPRPAIRRTEGARRHPARQAPGSGQKTADIYARLLAAEPHATAERKHELRIEAAWQARQSPLYFDLPLSLSKSLSIFHASLGENAGLAREVGDQAGDKYWSALVAEVDTMARTLGVPLASVAPSV